MPGCAVCAAAAALRRSAAAAAGGCQTACRRSARQLQRRPCSAAPEPAGEGDPLQTSNRISPERAAVALGDAAAGGAVALRPPQAELAECAPRSTAPPAPRWIDDRSRSFLLDPSSWKRPRYRVPPPELRDFDREREEDPERYARQMWKESVEGETPAGAQGGELFTVVDVDDKRRIRRMRENNIALRDHLIEQARTDALDKVGRLDAEGAVGEHGYTDGEWATLRRAATLASAPDEELLEAARSAERVLELSQIFRRAAGALNEGRFGECLSGLDQVLPFLGDWWEGNERLKWQGGTTLGIGTSLRELEATFFTVRGHCRLRMRDRPRAISDLTLAADLMRPVYVPEHDGETEVEKVVRLRSGRQFIKLLTLRAHTYLLDGQWRRALADADEILSLEEDALVGYELRMNALERLGEYDAALEAEVAYAAAEKRARSQVMMPSEQPPGLRPTMVVPHADTPLQQIHTTDYAAKLTALRRRRDALQGRRMKVLEEATDSGAPAAVSGAPAAGRG
eukprot:TRINITY_DN60276_c0_g1_i1.p1 TRINITY_DN60276_c0_g1~~TRINITY_DN60276_c0_g1_i1.p1  ORF type:complete len:536 (+),score=185.18 TRINITY_DN60276_c0_g1_i1:71-1609(+)